MPSYDYLYFLENFYLYIIEVKRNDLPADAPMSDKFKWLWIEKDNLEITQLNFRSMDSASEIEERFFEEGYLKFNDSIGTFIEKYNSAQHPLTYRKDFEITPTLQQAITSFMEKQTISLVRAEQ